MLVAAAGFTSCDDDFEQAPLEEFIHPVVFEFFLLCELVDERNEVLLGACIVGQAGYHPVTGIGQARRTPPV